MQPVRFAIAIGLLATGCVKRPVTATPTAIRDQANPLLASGSAEVEVMEGGRHRLSSEQVVLVETAGKTRSRYFGLVKEHRRGETRQLSIGQLVAGCDEMPGDQRGEDPPCLVEHLIGAPIEIGKRREFDGRATARVAGSLMAIGLVGYCAVECDNAGATIGGTVLLIGLLLVLEPLKVFQ